MWQGLFDFAYAAKAWVGGVVFAGTQLVAGVQLAVADEAITFTEARGILLLVTEFVGAVALVVAVFRKRNAPSPT